MSRRRRTGVTVVATVLSLAAVAGALHSGFGVPVVASAAAMSADAIPPLDPAEALPGGAATSRASTDTANAFSDSSGNLPFERELDFKVGNAIFRKFWVSSPSSTKASDGLGPLYNARSCQGCHLKDGRGHPPSGPEEAVSMFLRLSIAPETDKQRALLAEHRINVVPDPVYGGQLQSFAVQGHAVEGRMLIAYEEVPAALADGTIVSLRRPTYSVGDPGYGPLHEGVMLSPRVAPQMIGLGLLEAIPDADLLANADPDDADGDGISGRVNLVWSIADLTAKPGRFGWKAGNPTVAQQAADAFAGDIGIGSSMVPHAAGDCTDNQPLCLSAPNGSIKGKPEIEIGDDLLALVAFYSRNLAVPPRRDAEDPAVLAGRTLFHEIGCAACHHPSFVTGEAEGEPHLSHQKIWPYTDLLLHDMGDGLADNRPEGLADGREWRTPPLWGIGLTQTVSGHTLFLHDGRARNLTEAILWHGGEAEAARNGFAALSAAEREALIKFVSSL
ncbi:MAG: di-heme oxidoredictase family protein [Hyphomicrobiaceae bacterium]